LEYLSIGHVSIDHSKPIEPRTLCKILQKNRQMRELHLEMMEINIETVVTELNSCPNFEVINITFSSHFLFPQDINPQDIIIALAACKNLRKIFFHM